jgi:hypothetical protein
MFVQAAVESGEPLDEALRALTGEDGPVSGKQGKGASNRVEGHMSGKPRPGSSGYVHPICILLPSISVMLMRSRALTTIPVQCLLPRR